MNVLTHRLILDMHTLTAQATVHIKKSDTKNKLVISLTENGKMYTISEASHVAFVGKKPDGKIVFNNCDVVSNTIEYTITAQTSAVAGIVECEVRLYDANENLLTSPRFNVVVDEILFNGDEIESDHEINVLDSLISEATALIADMEEKLETVLTEEHIAEAVDNYFEENPVKDGEDGGYYKPKLEEDGTLLFIPSKDDMLPIGSVGNIKGQKGDPGYTPQKGVDYFDGKDGNPGAKGDDGKSAYEYAVEGGYKGTEEEFAQKIAVDPDWIATKKVMGGEEVYIAQQTLSSGLWDSLQMNFQVGLTYDVYISGEIYPCVAGNEDGGIYLGNITLMDSTSTKDHNNEPFCVYWAGAGATGGFFYKGSGLSYPLTLKVTNHADYVYSQMPKEYLPDEAALKTDIPTPDYKQNTPDALDYIKNRPFYSEYITLFEQSNSNVIYGTIGVSAKFDLYIGEEYKVTINGTVYNSVCKYSDQEGKILGNPKYYSGEDNGESYGISLKNGKLRGAFADISPSPTNLKIEYESIKKMEKKFLPDGVAFVDDLPEGNGLEVIDATADKDAKGLTLSVTGAEVFEKFNEGKHVVIRADFGEELIEFEYFATQDDVLCFNAFVPTNHQGYYTLDEYVLEIDNDSEKIHYYYDVLRHSGSSSGGTSIDVTAEVGQTIIVKEVDANGKPTKWESADYQPRTHYMETVLPETEGVFEEEMGGYMLPLCTLVAGKTYTVDYNGVEYDCTAFAIGEEGVVLGNAGVMDETFAITGEPFICILYFDTMLGAIPLDGAESVKISIKEAKPIPQQYLANANPYYIDVTYQWSGVSNDGPHTPTITDTSGNVVGAFMAGREIKLRVNVVKDSGDIVPYPCIYHLAVPQITNTEALAVLWYLRPQTYGVATSMIFPCTLPEVIPVAVLADGTLTIIQ